MPLKPPVMKSKVLLLIMLLCHTAGSYAQSGNYQKVADDYKKKIEATQDPNEKLRLALELQKIMLGESVVSGSLTPIQAAGMYDKKYKVKFQAGSDETIVQNCASCGPCGAHTNSKDHYDINASFVLVMHRPYGTYMAAAGKQSEVEQLTAAGAYSYTSNSTGCGKPEQANSTGHLDLAMNERAMDFNFNYNTNDKTWAINLNLPYAVHTSAQNGESDDAEMFGSSVNNYQEGAVITEKDGKITITANYTVNDNDAQRGITKKSNTSITAILTPYDETRYDALIVPFRASNKTNDKDYENWIPYGRSKNANHAEKEQFGNAIGFKIKLVDKDNPTKDLSNTPYEVEWQLESSEWHGDCTNWPIESDDILPDLRFALSGIPKDAEKAEEDLIRSGPNKGAACNPVIVRCYDYGAYGKLKAHVRVNTGSDMVDIDAHLENTEQTTVVLPKDENDNRIADAWEKQEGIFDKNYGPINDGEQQPDNPNDGDGLALFEEYRGLIAQDSFKRLDARNKNLIVVNQSKQVDEAALAKFTDYTGLNGNGGIKLCFLKPDEINTKTMWVNTNPTPFKGGNQHGILIKDIPLDTLQEAVAKAVAHGGDNASLKSPKDLDHIWIMQGFRLSDQPYIKNVALFKTNVVCHEIAHACGVTHHNGDVAAKYVPFSTAGINGQKAIFYDVDKKKLISYSDIQAIGDLNCIKTSDYKESEGSGDPYCLMTYNSMIPLSAYHDFFLNKYGIAKDLILFRYPSDEFRNGFCRNKNNKLWNIPSNNKVTITEMVEGKEKTITEEVSMYGAPIKGGNCISQFQVKDW